MFRGLQNGTDGIDRVSLGDRLGAVRPWHLRTVALGYECDSKRIPTNRGTIGIEMRVHEPGTH